MIKVSELENNIEHVVFEGVDKFNALIADEARDQLFPYHNEKCQK